METETLAVIINEIERFFNSQVSFSTDKKKEGLKMLHFLTMLLDFAATFVFGWGGYMLAKQARVKPILPMLACSFGGGLIRDLATTCITGIVAAPAALSAYTGWTAVALALACSMVWERIPDYASIRNCHAGPYLYTLIDYAGAGLFLAAGIARSVSFGLRNPLLLLLAGTATAIGGGILARLLFLKGQRITSLLRALPYYLAVFVTSITVVSSNVLLENANMASLWSIVSCAFAGGGVLHMGKAPTPMLTLSSRGKKISQRIGFFTSPGAYFWQVQNPRKGIRQWVSFPSGIGNAFQLVTA